MFILSGARRSIIAVVVAAILLQTAACAKRSALNAPHARSPAQTARPPRRAMRAPRMLRSRHARARGSTSSLSVASIPSTSPPPPLKESGGATATRDAREFYHRACVGRLGDGCLEMLRIDMQAVAHDPAALDPRSLALACKSGGPMFCVNLAAGISEKAPTLAMPLFQWGCARGVRAGCRVLDAVCPENARACTMAKKARADYACLGQCKTDCLKTTLEWVTRDKKENAPSLNEGCNAGCVKNTCPTAQLEPSP